MIKQRIAATFKRKDVVRGYAKSFVERTSAKGPARSTTPGIFTYNGSIGRRIQPGPRRSDPHQHECADQQSGGLPIEYRGAVSVDGEPHSDGRRRWRWRERRSHTVPGKFGGGGELWFEYRQRTGPEWRFDPDCADGESG